MKALKKKFKLVRRVCQTILVIGVTTFVLLLCGGGVDVSAQSTLLHQYQTRQQQALITHVDTKKIQLFNKLIKSDVCGLVFSPQTKQDLQKIMRLFNNRQQNQRQIASYFDGNYYANTVTKKRLDRTDQNLLKEKNQTVYQRQKNRLDTIRIWFDQTQDANQFLKKTTEAFKANHDQLDLTQVSQANAYYKLIKNRRWQHYWKPQINEILAYFKNSQANRDKNQLQQEKEQLAALKNAPLTQSYQPAHVTIVDNVQVADDANKALQAAGITANEVLYLSQSDQTLSLLRRSNGRYRTSGPLIRIIANNTNSGLYRIREVITNPAETAGVVTDRTQPTFGRYYSDATVVDSTTNSVSDYNHAQPTFWLKNNPALQMSIMFGNSRTIGFIYSGSSALNNGIVVENSDLITLTNLINSGTTLYIN